MELMTPPHISLPIDTAFDTQFADQLARIETFNKHHYRPNTYLHKWWGRRCGSTFRLILKGLVQGNDAAGYYVPGGLEGKVILDPMMGGGTTAHETIRLGGSFIGVDIDPIPILQARATLTQVSLADLESAFSGLLNEVRRELEPLFTTACPTCARTVPFWHMLYGLRQHCGCSEVWLVDSLDLRQETDGTMLRFCERCGEVSREAEHICELHHDRRRIVDRHAAVCDVCDQPYQEIAGLPYYQRYAPVAVAGHCPEHHLFYKSLDSQDRERWQSADDRRGSLRFERESFQVVPGDKSAQLLRRGIDSYLDLFSTRQLLVMEHAIDQLPENDELIRLNLALLLSTSLEFNSLLCGFKGTRKRRSGAVRHTFSHHAYSFPYTALENNPIYRRRSSGTLAKLFAARIVRGKEWAAAPRERVMQPGPATFVEIDGERDTGCEVSAAADLIGKERHFRLHQGSATRLLLPDNSVDAVVTDPPYFDSIQYSDLAAFFRVWLRDMLPDMADWQYDQDGSAVGTRQDSDSQRYRLLMTGIFQECHRVVRNDCGRLVFTFHHWRAEAWAALASSLMEAGFVLVNRYVVHSEHPVSVHVANMRALTHDAILVLAPREATGPGTWTKPVNVRTDNSASFCEDCGQLLGWSLANGHLTPDEMLSLWQRELN